MTDRGSRLENSGWEPDDKAKSFAISLGLDPDKVWPGFRDFWIAKTGANAVKKDWAATWRNWCRSNEANQKLRPDSPSFDEQSNRNLSPTALAIKNGEIPRCPLTGVPRVVIDGKTYDFLAAQRIKSRLKSKWGITDHERRVLDKWRMT